MYAYTPKPISEYAAHHIYDWLINTDDGAIRARFYTLAREGDWDQFATEAVARYFNYRVVKGWDGVKNLRRVVASDSGEEEAEAAWSLAERVKMIATHPDQAFRVAVIQAVTAAYKGPGWSSVAERMRAIG
jgi:hypothetical protein